MTAFTERPAHEQASLLERLANLAVGRWPVDCVRLEPIKVRENAVYAVHTASQRRLALRIHRFGYHSDESLESEFAWTRALQSGGIEVPQPVASRAGRLFERVELPGMDGPRQVDVFEWIDGQLLGPGNGNVNTDVQWVARSYGAVGEVAAQMHNQASVWQIPAGFRRHAWDIAGLMGEQPLWGRFWELDALTPDQRAFFLDVRERIKADLAAYGTAPDRYGLIHADLVPENIIADGERLRVIDFDDAGFGWYMFELATSLYFLRRKPIYALAREALINGYRRHRVLSEEHLKLLPLFLAARGTTYLAWLHTRKGEAAAQGRTASLIQLATEAAAEYYDTPEVMHHG